MFKAFLLIFRKKLIENIIIKIYRVVVTIKTFLEFVLGKHYSEEITHIEGVSVDKIKSLIRILDITERILSNGAKYILGLDLSISLSGKDPLDDLEIESLEKDLTKHLEELESLKQ